MVRPQSIIRYEQLYLASFVLGLIVSASTWTSRAAMLSANPMLAGRTSLLWVVLILGVAITLTLWYFTARDPHAAAKWIVVAIAVLTAIGVVTSLARLATGRIGFEPPVIAGLIVNALYITAAALLFRRDALPWFGGDAIVEGPPA